MTDRNTALAEAHDDKLWAVLDDVQRALAKGLHGRTLAISALRQHFPPPTDARSQALEEADLDQVARIIDPEAMRTMEDRLSHWEVWVSDVDIKPGPRPVDRQALARDCAQKEYDELAAHRQRALTKARDILAAIRKLAEKGVK